MHDVVGKVLDAFDFNTIFPWQDARGNRNKKESSWLDTIPGDEPTWRKSFGDFLIDVVWSHSPIITRCIDDNDVLIGGKECFKTASRAIFSRFSNNKEDTCITTQSSNYDEMQHMFDDKLYMFFMTSIEHFLAKNGASTQIAYELEDVESVTISRKEVVFGGNRETTVGLNLRKRQLLYGLFSSLQMAPDVIEEDGGAQLNHHVVTVRYHLDVVCKELFHVTNILTGEIIQGHLDPVTRTHRVLLENSLIFEKSVNDETGQVESQLNGDWAIVDIDYWLAGNPFWSVEDSKDQGFLSPPT